MVLGHFNPVLSVFLCFFIMLSEFVILRIICGKKLWSPQSVFSIHCGGGQELLYAVMLLYMELFSSTAWSWDHEVKPKVTEPGGPGLQQRPTCWTLSSMICKPDRWEMIAVWIQVQTLSNSEWVYLQWNSKTIYWFKIHCHGPRVSWLTPCWATCFVSLSLSLSLIRLGGAHYGPRPWPTCYTLKRCNTDNS